MGKKIIKKQFLALSPNKTWEGFLGGAVCTFIFAFWWPTFWMSPWLICPVDTLTFMPFQNNLACTPSFVFQPATYQVPGLLVPLLGAQVTCLPVQLHSMALAAYASIFAPFGGFFASAIKRAYNKKDFAGLIPGHGGLMDRLDCQFIMLLCTSIHLETFVRFTEASVASVMDMISQLSTAEQEEVLAKLSKVVGQ